MNARERYAIARREASVFHGITRALYRAWERRERRKAYRRYMDSPEWQIVRAECMRRAKGKCEQCKRFAAREVHHVTYRADLFETVAGDCVALCMACHEKKHRKGKATRA